MPHYKLPLLVTRLHVQAIPRKTVNGNRKEMISYTFSKFCDQQWWEGKITKTCLTQNINPFLFAFTKSEVGDGEAHAFWPRAPASAWFAGVATGGCSCPCRNSSFVYCFWLGNGANTVCRMKKIQILFIHIILETISVQDPMDTMDLSQAALRSMAGNGMSLPCGGFTLLMAILCVEDS